MLVYCARRNAVLVFVAAMLFAAVACRGGRGHAVATPSSAASPVTASPTPVAAATVTTTVDPRVTARPTATLELSADPQALVCDGQQASKVTARVLDAAGQPVADGTAVHFDVQVFGSADPINTETVRGLATTAVIALGAQVGVVVNVTSGGLAASIRIDCLGR